MSTAPAFQCSLSKGFPCVGNREHHSVWLTSWASVCCWHGHRHIKDCNASDTQKAQTFPGLGVRKWQSLPCWPKCECASVYWKHPPQLSDPSMFSPHPHGLQPEGFSPTERDCSYRVAKTASLIQLCARTLPLCSAVYNKHAELLDSVSVREPSPPNPSLSTHESMCLPFHRSLTTPVRSIPWICARA